LLLSLSSLKAKPVGKTIKIMDLLRQSE